VGSNLGVVAMTKGTVGVYGYGHTGVVAVGDGARLCAG
jgi:hypothetical protein